MSACFLQFLRFPISGNNQISKRGKCSNANFNRRMFPHLPNNFHLAAGENSDQGLASARCIILHGFKTDFPQWLNDL